MVMEVSWWVEVTVMMAGEGTVVMDGWRDDGERGRVQWWCRNRWWFG